MKKDDLEKLMDEVAEEYGLGDFRYPAHYFAVIGNGIDEVFWGNSFDLETIRDFQAHLQYDETSIPIIWIKTQKQLESPKVYRKSSPASYFEFHFASQHNDAEIARIYFETLVLAGAKLKPELGSASDWILKSLNISLDDLSQKSQDFLLSV